MFSGVVCLGERQRQSSPYSSFISVLHKWQFLSDTILLLLSSNVVNNCLFSLLREVMPLEIAVLNVGMI